MLRLLLLGTEGMLVLLVRGLHTCVFDPSRDSNLIALSGEVFPEIVGSSVATFSTAVLSVSSGDFALMCESILGSFDDSIFDPDSLFCCLLLMESATLSFDPVVLRVHTNKPRTAFLSDLGVVGVWINCSIFVPSSGFLNG